MTDLSAASLKQIGSLVEAIVNRATDDLSTEVYRQGVLVEDLDDRFKADSELLRDYLKAKDQVDNHELRITAVESTQALLKKTVGQHSHQLKTI